MALIALVSFSSDLTVRCEGSGLLLSRAQNWDEPIRVELEVLLGGTKECIILWNRLLAFVVQRFLQGLHPFDGRQLKDLGYFLLLPFYLRETGVIPERFV